MELPLQSLNFLLGTNFLDIGTEISGESSAVELVDDNTLDKVINMTNLYRS